ncbi:hypothetical protein [Spartinivicinus poritis]|uniref:Transposase n=1 Tax=Spartinivicinus poritis TaxID=2994640 RepID=A0ABT5UHG2_9GAMM|nr:hypothetical protein [Spartinivicinus sp. A2-2]MDE1465836.1 hypothetical protein [Spartinivicinus sp. A2-2]
MQAVQSSRRLTADQKINIAFDAMSGMTITHTANKHGVSRGCVYAHQDKAKQAIYEAFDDTGDDRHVLFYVPVTKAFLYQVVLALVLICKSSYRDAMQFIRDIFDHSISLGQVAHLMKVASHQAQEINQGYDLSHIQNSATDELYHWNQPILAVVDIPSRFCAMLTKEECRDGDTWAVSLMDLMAQGYQPAVYICDHAMGMKAGFETALPDTQLRFDHFHLIASTHKLLRSLKNQTASATTAVSKLQSRMEKAKAKKQGRRLSAKLTAANSRLSKTQELYELVNTLCGWLLYDVLQLPGIKPNERGRLYDFIVEELSALKTQHRRIAAYVSSLKNQKQHLLAVSHTLHEAFEQITADYQVSIEDVWGICYNTRFECQALAYHQHSQPLADRLGEQYECIEDEVLAIMARTHRCSAMIENFNSRLRLTIDQRKPFNNRQLVLRQFILNHRPFQRSHHTHLIGKTPAEALTGEPHRHWLELLGYQRFKKPA